MTDYILHLKSDMLRNRMHQLAARYGLVDSRVLRISQALDRVVVEIMRREIKGEGGGVNAC